MDNRADFNGIVKPFFDKIRSFDPVIHGDLCDYVVGHYRSCVAFKGERVDYSFIKSELESNDIKLQEDMLIASYAFRIAVLEVDKCDDHDMIQIYDRFQEIGKKRGWSSLEFDKNCLNLMGIEVRKIKPPSYLPNIQMGSDYN